MKIRRSVLLGVVSLGFCSGWGGSDLQAQEGRNPGAVAKGEDAAELVQTFQRLLYQKVKEKNPEAVKIYRQAVKDGGKLAVTYPRMKVLVAKWKGLKPDPTHLEPKYTPEFTMGEGRTIHYSTKNRGHLLLAKANVNGVEGTFIIDTAASHTVVSDKLAQKLNLGDEIRSVESTGNAGDRQRLFRVRSLQVSDARFDNFDAFILPLSHLSSAMGQEISGLIGSNLLSVRPYTIRLAKQRIVYGRPAKMEGGFEIRLHLVTGRPGFEMKLNKREKVMFVIDSGATESIVPQRLYQGKTVKRGGQVELDINRSHGSKVREYGHPESMEAAGNSLKCIPLKLSGGGRTGLLGVDFLKHYNIFVDTAHRKLYFTRIKTK